jgi:hypothetical protein
MNDEFNSDTIPEAKSIGDLLREDEMNIEQVDDDTARLDSLSVQANRILLHPGTYPLLIGVAIIGSIVGLNLLGLTSFEEISTTTAQLYVLAIILMASSTVYFTGQLAWNKYKSMEVNRQRVQSDLYIKPEFRNGNTNKLDLSHETGSHNSSSQEVAAENNVQILREEI